MGPGSPHRTLAAALAGSIALTGCAIATQTPPAAAPPPPRATAVAPPAGRSCHAQGSGLYERPDPHCTPGALNPAVTQATIGETICRRGWSRTVRPPERVTEPEKLRSLAAYGDTGSPRAYEYDHFIPLELGGAVNDPRNLWPEPGASPNPKDAVEDALRRAVCDRTMALTKAQHAIATNWVALTGR